MKKIHAVLPLLFLLACSVVLGESKQNFKRTEDVIYGRKEGTALTLDVFQPGQPNGRGIFFMISGGFFSGHEHINADLYRPLLDRGYTVFAVVHGSQPRFIISEIEQDIHRAVRFVRHNAAQYGVDPNKLGITGISSGGHLALTMGTQGAKGNPDAKDPVEKESSEVQAVACFFPPTDFLNWAKDGDDAVGFGTTVKFQPAFGPRTATKESREKLGKELSPIYFVSSNSAPTLIIHGDSDNLVPVQQAHRFVKRCHEVGAPVKLIIREGKDHGWAGMDKDLSIFADWFDDHLLGKTTKK